MTFCCKCGWRHAYWYLVSIDSHIVCKWHEFSVWNASAWLQVQTNMEVSKFWSRGCCLSEKCLCLSTCHMMDIPFWTNCNLQLISSPAFSVWRKEWNACFRHLMFDAVELIKNWFILVINSAVVKKNSRVSLFIHTTGIRTKSTDQH